MMLICAVGFLVLAKWGLPVAALGALSISLSYGAEVDMAGYPHVRIFEVAIGMSRTFLFKNMADLSIEGGISLAQPLILQ